MVFLQGESGFGGGAVFFCVAKVSRFDFYFSSLVFSTLFIVMVEGVIVFLPFCTCFPFFFFNVGSVFG